MDTWKNNIKEKAISKNKRVQKSVTVYMDEDPDFCYTKPEMAKYLINKIDFEDGDIVMEPCKGKGAFYDNLPDNVLKEYCEIDEGKDYLDYDGEVDYTISNPPFVPRKLFWAFHLKAMKTTRKKIYWLINRCWVDIFTPKRLDEMKKYYGWYMHKFTVVSDKRWYGRYYFIEFSKEPNEIFDYSERTF